ncbi:hypothetical protein [Actinocrispum wychmicini]|uniref:hypothetical protein n=1 Tax=Actinocrispum wychmicini TaxID=1213861 RepID=UPI0010476FD1|nr:hypothetical protein [Actinocrispum wychmicini]
MDAPFQLPKNQLLPMSLDDVLDQQLVAGGAAALTPTGYIPAGDTDALKAAVGQVKQLRRTDVIFVVPLDVSLLGRAFIRQTTAILADADCPVGLVLGRQYDPLAQDTARIIPNLRTLAATVDLMPLRTDFNALDLVAHGAFAGAIGTGGTVRHTINPEEKSLARIKDQSPSVLFPELVCWWKGSKIADLYGARPGPRCGCAVCDEQQLTRFLRRTHQNEAHAHAVAVWEQWAGYMLEKPTMKDRAEFWRTLCASSLQEHQFITHRLQRKEPLKPQKPVEVWATLPAWPDS